MSKFVPPLSSIKNYGSCSASKFERNVAYSSELEEREEEQTLEFSHSEGTSYSPDVKLFVGNLPFNVNRATLAELFAKTENVEMVEVIYYQSLGRSRGFGFVTMFSVGEAEAVVQQLNVHELQGREIRVISGPPPPKRDNSSFCGGPRGWERASPDNTNRLYVGNLAWGIDNLALETLFTEQGTVKQARVVYEKESDRSRGFGFVT